MAMDWLAARESQDRLARSHDLAKAFAAAVSPTELVVDLGCGSGANYRYLVEYFPAQQNWIGIDVDADALKRASANLGNAAFPTKELDLANQLGQIPCGPGVALTASAFLDLTSAAWIDDFAMHCHDSPLLIAMTTSGIHVTDWRQEPTGWTHSPARLQPVFALFRD